MDELRDRGFEMPSHATPLVVECDAGHVQRIDEWFRKTRCRWNAIDARQRGGIGPWHAREDSSLLDAAAGRDGFECTCRGAGVSSVGRREWIRPRRGAAVLPVRLRIHCALDRDVKRAEPLGERRSARALESRVVRRPLATSRPCRVAGTVSPCARGAVSETRNSRGARVAPRAGRLLSTRSSRTRRGRRTRRGAGRAPARFCGLEVLRDDVEAIDDGREPSFFAARKRVSRVLKGVFCRVFLASRQETRFACDRASLSSALTKIWRVWSASVSDRANRRQDIPSIRPLHNAPKGVSRRKPKYLPAW